MRVNNLFDLHKRRIAKISDDYKKLIINFELKHPAGLKEKHITHNVKSLSLDCDIFVEYKKPQLSIEVILEKPDINKLYKIFLVIAYLLGDEIVLLYTYKNFPFYDIPHYFNFGNYSFCFTNNKGLLIDTKKYIETGYKLLIDEDSYFSKIVLPLLSINTMPFSDMRFFSEFSLLESLSINHKISGKIFDKKNDQRELKQFSESVLKYIYKSKFNVLKDDLFKQKIDRIMSPSSLNEKGSTKEKMLIFVEAFELQRIKNFKDYINKWNKLRSKRGVAHGNLFLKKPNKKISDKDRELKDKLHQLLSDIVYDEFTKYLAKK